MPATVHVVPGTQGTTPARGDLVHYGHDNLVGVVVELPGGHPGVIYWSINFPNARPMIDPRIERWTLATPGTELTLTQPAQP